VPEHQLEPRPPMLTSLADIDEKLRRMTESFHESLEDGPGLGLEITGASTSGRLPGDRQNGLGLGLGLIEGGLGGANLGGGGSGGASASTGYHSRARSSSTSLLGSSQRRSYDEVVGRLDLAEGTADPSVDVGGKSKKYEAVWGERDHRRRGWR